MLPLPSHRLSQVIKNYYLRLQKLNLKIITGLEGFISKDNLEELTRLQTLLEDYLSALKPLELDASLKKYRFQLTVRH